MSKTNIAWKTGRIITTIALIQALDIITITTIIIHIVPKE